MKRLKSKLLDMENDTTTYSEMYKATIKYGLFTDEEWPDPVYYNDQIGFEITENSHQKSLTWRSDKWGFTVLESILIEDESEQN